MGKFLADGGGLPSMENPVICSFWVYMINHSCPYDSRKSHVLGNFSQVIYENVLVQSDWKIF